MNIDKKIKGGLKICPLHKFKTEYNYVKDGWLQCSKCGAFHKPDEEILEDCQESWKNTVFQRIDIWSFKPKRKGWPGGICYIIE